MNAILNAVHICRIPSPRFHSLAFKPAFVQCDLAIELAPLNINAILPHGHTQVLHRQHRSILTATLPTTTVAWTLDSQRCALPLVFVPGLSRRLSRNGESCGSAQRTHRVVRVGGGCADAAVLVGIGSDVGDELLRCESEETCEARVGLRWWRQAGFGHIVMRHCVRDLEISVNNSHNKVKDKTYDGRVIIHLGQELSQRCILPRRHSRLGDRHWRHGFILRPAWPVLRGRWLFIVFWCVACHFEWISGCDIVRTG